MFFLLQAGKITFPKIFHKEAKKSGLGWEGHPLEQYTESPKCLAQMKVGSTFFPTVCFWSVNVCWSSDSSRHLSPTSNCDHLQLCPMKVLALTAWISSEMLDMYHVTHRVSSICWYFNYLGVLILNACLFQNISEAKNLRGGGKILHQMVEREFGRQKAWWKSCSLLIWAWHQDAEVVGLRCIGKWQFLNLGLLHSPSLTWNLKMMLSKRKLHISGCHFQVAG